MSIATVSCTTTACAFNNNGCNALAITIGGATGAATCGTFVTLDVRGGSADSKASVGACQRLECKFNNDLLCTADGVSIAGDTAQCQTYVAR